MSSLNNKIKGQQYWRSLAELEGTPELDVLLYNEFPEHREQLSDPLSRRRFFQLMGASVAFAGLTQVGCRRWEQDHIVPLSERPDDYIPGVPKVYSTAMELGGIGTGLRVTAYDGRPIKIEGNPNHPFSGGATSAFAQASILELYDPDRSQGVARRGKGGQAQPAKWDDFESFVRGIPSNARVRVLSEATSSQAVARLRIKLQERFPSARWVDYEPLSTDSDLQGTAMYFGEPMRPLYHLDKVSTLVTLDSNLLVDHPAAMRNAADFAKRRRPDSGQQIRVWSIESAFSHTGAVADHRLPLRSELVLPFVMALEAKLGRGAPPSAEFLKDAKISQFLDVLADELSHSGPHAPGLLVAGPSQPPQVHAIVARLNARLGAHGVTYLRAQGVSPLPPVLGIKNLVTEMRSGSVDVLLILGGNPVFNAPADIKFSEALSKVKTSVHLSPYEDETSVQCSWHIPRAHYLEAWGDTRTYDGTISITQPVIEPLHGGRSVIELLGLFAGLGLQSGRKLVRDTFSDWTDARWRQTLHDGYAHNSQFAPVRIAGREFASPSLTASQTGGIKPDKSQVEVVFTSSSHTYDGRFANNGWLQETPDFLTKVTWENAALIGPSTASALGIENDTKVKITVGSATMSVAVYVMPGQAPYSIALALGHGRTHAGNVGGHKERNIAPAGFDTYRLRSSEALYIATGATVQSTGQVHKLANVQDHWKIDTLGRKAIEKRASKFIRSGTEAQFKKDPTFAQKPPAFPAKSLFKEHEYPKNKWGMATDLGKCTGCNACMVACQAENNVPIVGKREVMRSREMHWIRIDRYFTGEPDDPRIAHQPMVCQQCENAPCEQVCPVGATIHTDEGLNDMVYNRCVGTRYCLNNCPYKVRRFNFLDYHQFNDARTRIRKLLFNPEVTVRSRGVMEKCTFCVQRIETAKIRAKNDRRSLQDGEIQTACQQSCPTGAIVFGDLNDKESEVSKLQSSPRAYAMLADLHIKPRNKFLAAIRNPNPKLVPDKPTPEAH